MKNHVVWVNPDFKTPFGFQKGQPSSLGLLLSLNYKEGPDFFLGVQRGHFRSSIVGQFVIKDRKERAYSEVSLKGSGLLAEEEKTSMPNKSLIAKQWHIKTKAGEPTAEVRGLLDFDAAHHDAIHAEKFTRLGIETHRVLAIIVFEELNIGSERVSVEECKEKGLLFNFRPVVQVRVFRTNQRLHDIIQEENENSETRKNRILEIIRSLWSKESVYLKEQILVPNYLVWLTQAVASHVGRMHKHRYLHRWLNPHNITLDGCLVDFDGVERMGVFCNLSGSYTREIRRDAWTDCYWSDGAGGGFKQTGKAGALESLQDFQQSLQRLFPEISALAEVDVATMFKERYESVGGYRGMIPL
ncbi:MAG: hypothetical protein HYS44_01605 [Candidatus Niyogibacteria bacterium]|nr:hypothetical protein [Candidatus Niyogibacteria bacterium]